MREMCGVWICGAKKRLSDNNSTLFNKFVVFTKIVSSHIDKREFMKGFYVIVCAILINLCLLWVHYWEGYRLVLRPKLTRNLIGYIYNGHFIFRVHFAVVESTQRVEAQFEAATCPA